MSIQNMVGKNIKRLRESRGWSQCRLADESGLHYTYISGMERGLRNPTVEVIYRISLALNVDPSCLFKQMNNEITEDENKAQLTVKLEE